MNLSGNTILITGGTSGIGLELAKSLIQRGNVVIVTGRSSDRLAKAKATIPGLQTILNDVARAEDVKALYQTVIGQFPKLNMVINNAGIQKSLNLHAAGIADDQLTQEIETNLIGPIRVTNIFMPHLKKQPAAAIVNVTSGLAFVPLPTSPIYCATKAAMHSFTLSLRVQLQGSSVKVFEIAPPATKTPMLESSDPEDMKGVTIMPVEKMVSLSLAGIEQDRYEIRPGQSNQLKMMSRIAPEFILKQLSRPVERMLLAAKGH